MLLQQTRAAGSVGEQTGQQGRALEGLGRVILPYLQDSDWPPGRHLSAASGHTSAGCAAAAAANLGARWALSAAAAAVPAALGLRWACCAR